MQAEMLANRVKKRFKHLRKGFSKQNINVFRLYDWDIPEIRMAVDWYDGHLVMAEYTRRQSIDGWLEFMGSAVAGALEVPEEKIHYKKRRAGYNDGKRYERLNYTNQKIIVSERDFRFLVNPEDYIDTGLFSDHRNTREMVRRLSKGKRFLNLYCYTGTFTCYAASGGAISTTSVDRSETAISWVNENLELNALSGNDHTTIAMPVYDFLEKAEVENQKFDLAVVDPPSYSTDRETGENFDIAIDHPYLLEKVARRMTRGGMILFSTNHQDFHLGIRELRVESVEEITAKTIPEDYLSKRKKIHRCWKIIV